LENDPEEHECRSRIGQTWSQNHSKSEQNGSKTKARGTNQISVYKMTWERPGGHYRARAVGQLGPQNRRKKPPKLFQKSTNLCLILWSEKCSKRLPKTFQKSTPKMLKNQFQQGSRRKTHEKCKNLQPSAVFNRLVVSTGVEHATTNVKTSYRKP
jgi:hypothetical protein